jgi:lipid-binding SYLF domain-containing protein
MGVVNEEGEQLMLINARLRWIAIILLVFGSFILVGDLSQSQAASARELQARVQDTLSEFREEVPGAHEVLTKAKGILVFPKVYQGGLVVGGKYGEGVLLIRGKVVDYYRLMSASYGFQLGGQRKSMIFAFMNDAALAQFRKSSGWQVGADASAAVFVVGADGSINSTTLNKPIIAFVLDQKGLMYNLSLEGTKIQKIQK